MKNFKLAIIPLLLAGCGGGNDVTPSTPNTPSQGAENPTQPPIAAPVAPPSTPQNGAPSNPKPKEKEPENEQPRPQPPDPKPPAEPPPPVVVEPPPAPENPEPPSPAQPNRYARDMPDDFSDPQVHVIYLKPADNVNDRQFDTNGTLALAAQSINRWLSDKASAKIRFDLYNDALDVTHATLEKSAAYYEAYGSRQRDVIENELRSQGILNGFKNYLVYYEGSHPESCGDADQDFLAIVYLRAASGNCYGTGFAGQAFGYLEVLSLHEILHTFGAEHTDDPKDIMYEGWLDPRVDRTIDPALLEGVEFIQR